MRAHSSGVIVFLALALSGSSRALEPFAVDSTQSACECAPAAVARAASGGGLTGLLALALTSAPLLDPRPEPAVSTPGLVALEEAVLIKTTQTSQYSPPCPDPSGLTYDPTTSRLIIADGEVEEMSIFAGVNLFQATLGGTLVATGDTMDYSIEPVGLAFNALNKHLFVSDDDAREVFEVVAGNDGKFGTSDDVVTHFDTVVFGCDDPEGIAYDSANNALFLIDGTGRKVFRVGVGPNGKFDGVPSKGGDDVISQFDVGAYGPQDPEGITWNPGSGTLYIVDDGSELIVEITTSGTLVRKISFAQANLTGGAGIEFAPGSTNPSAWHVYIISRGADNDSNPNENDGRLYELSISGVSPPGNAAPVVSAGPDQTTGIVGGAVLDGTVADDGKPSPPGAVTTTWSKVSGPGTVSFGSASSVDTIASFSATGTYVLRLTANDGQLAGSDELTVTVVSGGLVTIEVPVAASSDDAEEDALGAVTLNSSDLELVQDSTLQTVGLRFTSVAVPKGSAIPVAAIQFQTDEVNSGATTLLIQGQAIDNAPTFTTATANVSSRARTSASVLWTPPPWSIVGETGANQQTVDISPVIQELVNRPGWSSGNAIAILITGSGKRVATAFNGSPAGAPRLRVQHGGASPPTNQAPQVDAGAGQTVGLAGVAVLDATVNDDGLPSPPATVTTTWSKLSGPGSVSFASAAAVDTTASFSLAGTYVLRLTAHDGALSASDDVTITVAADGLVTVLAPVVAGSDDAEEDVLGAMSLSSGDLELVTDSTVQTVGVRFAGLAVPQGATVQSASIQFTTDEVSTAATSLTLQGQAADNAPTFTTAAANISSRPRTNAAAVWSPVAWTTAGEAGPNQQSVDISAVIQEIVGRPGWASGNALAIVITGSGKRVATAFNGSAAAAPRLRVQYGSASPGNQAPVVGAGPDHSVELSDGAVLDGTVSDDGLPVPPGAVTATWSKLSGPGTVGFANAGAVDTTASFSQLGTYVLRLTASDGALAASDEITITVTPDNQAPVVLGGPDLVASKDVAVLLDGTVTDDGLPNPPGALTATWTKVSGSGGVTFANAGAVDTQATFHKPGTFVVRLTASDGSESASDDVTVVVLPKNQAPAVYAGPDRSVGPGIAAELHASITDDGLPDPPATLTVSWTPLQGPGRVNFTDPGALDTSAEFGAPGTYVLLLTATDGELSSSDDVVVSVQPDNLAPVVDAGPDQSVSFDLDAVLDATVTDDGLPEPVGLTTLWTLVSGPGDVAFGDAAAVDTSASFPAPGTYVLQLAAGDGALQSTDEITITVTPGLFIDLGGGAPGVGGLPTMTAKSLLTVGSTLTVSLHDAAPGAPMLLWLSFSSQPVNVFGGTVYAYPPVFQTLLVTGLDGSFTSSTAWPDGIASGTDVFLQFLIRDLAVGVSLSNAVTAQVP
jgi:hypothetical protein